MAREVRLDIPPPEKDHLWKALFPSMALMQQEMAASGSWAEEDTKPMRGAEVAEYTAWRQTELHRVHAVCDEDAAPQSSLQNL